MVFGGSDWGHSFTLFSDDWIRREWNQYLDVVAIEPNAEAYQSAVVLGTPNKTLKSYNTADGKVAWTVKKHTSGMSYSQ